MPSLVFLLALCVAGAVHAGTPPTGNRISTAGKGSANGNGATLPRVGGEDIPGAVEIQALPFNDTGATCGYVNDYDEVCPYAGSTAPDVVYKYTPALPVTVTIDLCASAYDTKVYVYAGGPGNLVACNDDAGCGYSGWQSRIGQVSLSAGVTCFIVVDGYGESCGTYDIGVSVRVPCVVECPPGSVAENEPPCRDGYLDSYNAGCNQSPTVFQPLFADGNHDVDLCGKSGTYFYEGMSYRDIDWFDVIGLGQPVTTTCTAEFPLQLLNFIFTDCNVLMYDIITAPECVPAAMTHYISDGAHMWIWVGPQVFAGIPCEVDYLLHVDGILEDAGVPAESASWGRIKARYTE